MKAVGSTGNSENWRTRTDRRKWVGRSVAGAAALVVILYLTANVAGAAVYAASTVDKAPFKGTPYDFADVGIYGCGTSLAFTTTPSFNVTTGLGLFNASSKVKACADLTSTDYVDIYGGVGYNGSEWTQATTGSVVVTVAYSLSWSAAVSAKPSKNQSAVATASVFVEVFVSSASNNTEISFGYMIPLDLSESKGSTSSLKTAQSVKVATNAVKLLKGHKYWVTTELDLTVDAEVASTGASTASASLSLEPTGSSSKLVSITIS